ncbi:hypothetical protein [Pseudochrobactrum saccharolyticum]|uniref:Uncharacterized protein n=1 Tax=Pseudochrobactrum saccharolyticum TaxID=354352 RepID=A0A7W8ALH9_9HYPH|nr:hypothetical protein [Pseudochrobactrum saccharolyticum]KAB0538200.1 hypothetical protein F7P81_10785 [Pseudochrobactrum saccharolyticum]MBB5091436.1 hypothetical protein [Pseudochrobactrum saccharolyticum]MBX8785241.1 hypothetical protein [Ochrobactrum sp. GRS2]MDP8250655.1 hypothetical protein [Pseudochrobactrum saccharolyticum]
MKIFYNPTDGVYTSATGTPVNEDDIVVPARPPEKSTYHPDTNSWTIDPVEPEIPLTPKEQRALMPPLEKWRFDTIIDSRPGLRDKIESAIDRNISDLLQRVTVRNKFRSVTQFSRLDPMFPFLASDPDINISDLEIDEMWRQGLALT